MRHHTMNGFLNLRCYFLFDIFFQSSKHEWLQNQMQPFKLMLVKLTLVHRMLFNVFRKPFLKLLVIIEKLRHDEMKQCPEFCHRILDWSS
jgi:hypothetical protein